MLVLGLSIHTGVKNRKLIQDLEGLNMQGSKTYAESNYPRVFEAVKSIMSSHLVLKQL